MLFHHSAHVYRTIPGACNGRAAKHKEQNHRRSDKHNGNADYSKQLRLAFLRLFIAVVGLLLTVIGLLSFTVIGLLLTVVGLLGLRLTVVGLLGNIVGILTVAVGNICIRRGLLLIVYVHGAFVVCLYLSRCAAFRTKRSSVGILSAAVIAYHKFYPPKICYLY